MQQRKTNGSHNWFYSNSQNISVFKHISVQHLLPCSILKCSQVTKFLVLLLMSFLQSQNNLAMDKIVTKTGLMLGSVRASLGGEMSAAPLIICTVTVSPRTVTCHPSPGHSSSEGFPECHRAQNSDSKADSSGVTAAPLTAPPFPA